MYFKKTIKKILNLTKLKYVILKPINIRNIVFGYDSSVECEGEQESIVYPIKYFKECCKKAIQVKAPSISYCILTKSKLLGGSNSIIYNRHIYNPYIFYTDKNINITDHGLLSLWSKVVRINKHYILNYSTERRLNIDEGICLCGNYSYNYYHFVYELLVKFYILNNLNIDNRVPIILDERIKKIPQFLEALSIISNNRRILYIKYLELVTVSKLHYISDVNIIPPNFIKTNLCRSESIIFNIRALKYLRQNILNHIVCDFSNDSSTRLFLSRKNTTRRKYNEEDVVSIIKNYDFKIVYPELCTFVEQVQLFRQASIIIAASGAALTNILFASPSCKILVLVSSRFELTIFSTIAGALSIEMEYISGTIDNGNNIQSHFVIDTAPIKDYLEHIN